MNKFIWTLQIILALFFVVPGTMKMIVPREKMIQNGQLKPTGSTIPIRTIGLLELLGCVGIILPLALRKFPVLTPVSAIGFGLVMIGAVIYHLHRSEYKVIPLLSFVFVISAFVAVYRFKNLN